jgi:hypothetical protein
VRERRDATELPVFRRFRNAILSPTHHQLPIVVAPVKLAAFFPYLSHNVAFLSFSLPSQATPLPYILFYVHVYAKRGICPNERTHAPRSVATAVGAGRCLQSNCGGNTTVAPPKDAATAVAAARHAS